MTIDENPQATSEKKDQEGQKRLPLSEAVLLTLASAGAYLLAFIYEYGYATFFGIPMHLINVSLINLLASGVVVMLLIISSFMTIDTIFPLTNLKHPYLAKYIPRVIGLFFIWVFVPSVMYGSDYSWVIIITVGTYCLLVSWIFIAPLVVYRGKGKWTERYNAELLSRRQKSSPDFDKFIEKRLGIKQSKLTLAMLAMSMAIIYRAGENVAKIQRDFFVIDTSPAMVVLRVYGDNMICAPFDRNAHEVKRSFSVRKIAEDPKLVMSLENVGPLNPVEKLTSETTTPSSPTPLTPKLESAPSTTPTPKQAETPSESNSVEQ
ncbi:MAG: hypothetical protein ABW007_11310 [Chitinophagaceae bacterium]